MNSRHQLILQLVNKHGKVSVTQLANTTGVSEVTIRQDLNQLEKQRYLKRVHGSAMAVESDDVDTRLMFNFTLKQQLARHAASLVQDGETLFIEGGSANALLARYLAEHHQITLITSSAYIAHLLKETECDVILLGGIYQKKSEMLVGPLTRLSLQHLHFSKVFIGIDGFCPETGFTGNDMMRTEVVNTVLAKGCDTIIISDSSKFGHIHPNPIGPLSSISRLITDDQLTRDQRHYIEQSGIKVDIIADLSAQYG